MSVTDRTPKARACATFAKIVERDAQGRVKVALVPGSECKIYQVIIRRNGHISVECNCQTSLGNVPCKGNGGPTICYHSMAALLVASESAGAEVSFCDNEADARKLENLGRTVTRITSHQGNGVIWLAVRKPATMDNTPAPRNGEALTTEQKRAMMYGEA